MGGILSDLELQQPKGSYPEKEFNILQHPAINGWVVLVHLFPKGFLLFFVQRRNVRVIECLSTPFKSGREDAHLAHEDNAT